MELVASGWSRDHGENVIAMRDLTEARSQGRGGYTRTDAYVSTTEAKEPWPFGVRTIENGNVELRFYAKITLNGEYLIRQTMSRKEVAKLFLSLYDDCSLQEIVRIIDEVKETAPNGNFPPVMLRRSSEMGLSDRTVSALQENNISHVGDLVQRTEDEMLQALNKFGYGMCSEIKERLTALGVQFGMKVPNWPAAPGFPSPLLRRVDEFPLSVRTENGLKNQNITYVGELVQLKEGDLLMMPTFGRKTRDELKEVLAGIGLWFGMEVPNWSRSAIEERKRLLGR